MTHCPLPRLEASGAIVMGSPAVVAEEAMQLTQCCSPRRRRDILASSAVLARSGASEGGAAVTHAVHPQPLKRDTNHSGAARRIVPEQTAFVVERFGRYKKTLSPGIHILIPVVSVSPSWLRLCQACMQYDLLQVRLPDEADQVLPRARLQLEQHLCSLLLAPPAACTAAHGQARAGAQSLAVLVFASIQHMACC